MEAMGVSLDYGIVLQGSEGPDTICLSTDVVAVAEHRGHLTVAAQEASPSPITPVLSISRSQGLALVHSLAQKRAQLGDVPGEGKVTLPDSQSPVVVNNLARKVRFIDGRPSLVPSKNGVGQRSYLRVKSRIKWPRTLWLADSKGQSCCGRGGGSNGFPN